MARIRSCAVLSIGGLLLSGSSVWAQSVVPNGANTTVTSVDGDYQITGGTSSSGGENLFHSFEQFGLTAAEAATFVTQPNVVNVIGRINGGSPSIINGQLGITGSAANLFLLNPVGVVFGPDVTLALPGNLNVSTADGLAFGDDILDVVGTPDYASLVGNPTGLVFRFSSPGSIINAADLNLGANSSLTLAGGTVVSTGNTSAGEVAIASVPGEQLIRLNPDGSLLSYDIAPSGDIELSPLTLPELLTGAGDIANSLQLDADGTVRLVNSDLTIPDTPGTTIVNGDITAGEITLLGDTIGVVSSLLDASAPDGGGVIQIGGSYQGQGPLPNAEIVYVSADSVVDASATVNGDGGEIIVWSNQTTNALGQFLAVGGPNGGDGGLIETSGLQGLTLGNNTPDVSAPAGTGGLWLIDPFNVVIGQFEASTEFSEEGAFSPLTSPAQLDVDIIINALRNGDVTVNTGADGDEEGNITLINDLLYDNFSEGEGPVNTLTLDAAGSIFINASIAPLSFGDPININLLADTDNTGNGQVVVSGDAAAGLFTRIDTAGGDLLIEANSTTLDGVADTSGIIIDSDTTISAVGFNGELFTLTGSVTLDGTASDGAGVKVAENSFINAGNNITITGESDTDVGVLVDGGVDAFGGSLRITGNSADNPVGILISNELNAGNQIRLISDSDIQVESLVADGNITVRTPKFFRATGIAEVFLSEEEFPDLVGSVVSRDGQVTITHGGNGETPFEVGDAEVNGTAGAIIATESEIQPSESFLKDEIRGDISILTGEKSDPEDPEDPQDPEEPEDPELPDVDDCTADCTTERSNPDLSGEDPDIIITVEPQLLPEAQQAILRNENNYTDEFRDYLNLGTEEFTIPNLPQVQMELSLIAEETGEPPAIVYVSFIPADAAGDTSEVAPKADREIQATDILELVVITPDGPPILRTLPVQHEQVQKTAERFRSNVINPGRLRTRTYLSAAQELHSWLIAPLEAELTRRGITNLAFVMPAGLRSLPVSALHDGEQFLIERYSVGLMPSVSLTDLRYVDVRKTEVLAMGASDFADQPELPAVPIELSTIAEQLWPGDFVINETFTPDSLKANRARKPYGIVHLATHGEFKAGSLDNSYIQFWDQRLTLDQVRSLGLNNPAVELMVLSACRTALGNEEAELGFAGLAVQAGVKTAIASLWKVDDVGTAGLMTQFYTSLQTEPIKAEALRQAQLAMINGDIRVENGQLIWSGGTLELPDDLSQIDSSLFSHPYFWASFTAIGSPW